MSQGEVDREKIHTWMLLWKIKSSVSVARNKLHGREL